MIVEWINTKNIRIYHSLKRQQIREDELAFFLKRKYTIIFPFIEIMGNQYAYL